LKQRAIIEETKEEKKEKFKNSFSVSNMIKEAYLNKPDTHKNKEGYVSISQISGNSCLRKAYYKLQKTPIQNKSFEGSFITGVGNSVHDSLQEVLENLNTMNTVFPQFKGIEEYFEDHDLRLTGSTDGYFEHKDGSITVNDFKTCGLNMYLYLINSNKPKKDHVAQVHWYAYLYKKQQNKVINDLKITYICKNQGKPYFINDEVLKSFDATHSYLKNLVEWYEGKDKEVPENLMRAYYQANSHLEELNKLAFNHEEDFMFKEFTFKYDESIIEAEIEKLKQFWERIDEGKKLPNKISTKYICDSCPYLKTCRG